MLAYDVAAGGAEDVADEEDVHLKILHWGDGAEAAHVAAVVLVCLGGK
jgi:ABC-type proline/glycine betaine transport system substrate-binding protein